MVTLLPDYQWVSCCIWQIHVDFLWVGPRQEGENASQSCWNVFHKWRRCVSWLSPGVHIQSSHSLIFPWMSPSWLDGECICTICSSSLHSVDSCPRRQTSSDRWGCRSDRNTHGRPVVHHGGQEICNYFNGDQGCSRPQCLFMHVYLVCRARHAQLECKGKPLNKGKWLFGKPWWWP